MTRKCETRACRKCGKERAYSGDSPVCLGCGEPWITRESAAAKDESMGGIATSGYVPCPDCCAPATTCSYVPTPPPTLTFEMMERAHREIAFITDIHPLRLDFTPSRVPDTLREMVEGASRSVKP